MYSGKKVAFVATGGFSRGIAHAGVLKACEQMGIKFDLLVGASAGALAAVFYSQYGNSDKLIDHFRPAFNRKYKFKQFGWRRMFSFKNFFDSSIASGLFSLKGLEDYLEEALITNDFDELRIPTYVSVTSLKESSGLIYGTGLSPKMPISKALAASCCAPVLFRPIEFRGDLYVDGEIKRPISTRAAIEYGADVIIVSDMYGPPADPTKKSNVFGIFSQIVNMLFEDKSFRGMQVCKAEYPDKKIIKISPSIAEISSVNTFAYKKLINAGYNSAIKVLRDIKE